jgi:hypothetical protein
MPAFVFVDTLNEGLQTGQRIDRVVVINPFRSSPGTR